MDTNVLEPPAEQTEQTPVPRRFLPDAVLWLLAAPDSVEVMSLIPVEPNDEEDGEVVDGPGRLYGHHLRGVARVPTSARRLAVARAFVGANREGDGWALCFDPHYAVRVSRGGRTADFLICFWCGNVRVVMPGADTVTYPFGRSAERLLRRELRRGGVGWLWFWRRWLA